MSEKKTESVRVWMSPQLRADLASLAAHEHRSLSDYVHLILLLWVYGHGDAINRIAEEANRDE